LNTDNSVMVIINVSGRNDVDNVESVRGAVSKIEL
jgi:hypothetical protein